MFDYSKLIERQKKKIEQEKIQEDILFNELNAKARMATKKLADKFRFSKIYLFGSLTDKYRFHLNSDIDLAIEGLKSEDYLDAWGELERLLGNNFDLVQLEKARDSLKEIIWEEGVVIYESRQKNC